jgi:S1-C subfamily serine protease
VAHVLGDGGAARVLGADGVRRAARLVRIDEQADLAVLVVGAARAARVTGSPAALGGTHVTLWRDGRPQARAARVVRRFEATFRDLRGAVRRRPALEVAADIAPGDSGAPVVDGRGRVLGVVFARSLSRRGVAYAVDASALDGLGG